MGPELDSALRQAAATTFEQLGFLFAEEELTDDQAEAPWGESAVVHFTGPMTGRVEVSLSENVLAELAANMLGLIPPVARTIQRDALGEVTNVICGNVLPSLAGAEAVFDLEAPTSHPIDPDLPVEGGRTVLGIGFGRAAVRIVIDPTTEAA